MDQLVTINIFGQPFSFTSEADTEQAKTVAGQLESEIARITSTMTVKRIREDLGTEPKVYYIGL